MAKSEWHFTLGDLLKSMTRNPHAQALGKLGGLANKGIPKPKSAENGKKGGRPKKILK